MGFRYEWRVRPGQTDFSGLVYTPEVVDAVLMGIEELMHEIGEPFSQYTDREFMSPTVNVNVNYLSSMEVGDIVTIEITPSLGETSVVFSATGQLQNTPAFEGSLTMAFIDKTNSETTPVPELIQSGLRTYADA
jgi:4-hydroxybenzoyl-CoA thioesterase